MLVKDVLETIDDIVRDSESRKKKVVDILFIEADEDYVPM